MYSFLNAYCTSQPQLKLRRAELRANWTSTPLSRARAQIAWWLLLVLPWRFSRKPYIVCHGSIEMMDVSSGGILVLRHASHATIALLLHIHQTKAKVLAIGKFQAFCWHFFTISDCKDIKSKFSNLVIFYKIITKNMKVWSLSLWKKISIHQCLQNFNFFWTSDSKAYITSDALKIEPSSVVFYYCGWFEF